MDMVVQKTHEDIKKQKSRSHFYPYSNSAMKQTPALCFSWCRELRTKFRVQIRLRLNRVSKITRKTALNIFSSIKATTKMAKIVRINSLQNS